jgi:hypothetical protein
MAYVCGLYGVGYSGYEGRLLRWRGSGAGFKKPGTNSENNLKTLDEYYPGCIDAWRKRGLPDNLQLFFECPDIMSRFHLAAWKIREFEAEQCLGDPRGARPNYVGYMNPYAEHMLVFVRQKDPCTGLDSASMFKMDLNTRNGQTVVARAKLAVGMCKDQAGRCGP